MLTLAEYLEDYAQNGTREKEYRLIRKNLEEMEYNKFKSRLKERLDRVRQGERDLYFYRGYGSSRGPYFYFLLSPEIHYI